LPQTKECSWADTVAPEYGEQELKQACKTFTVNYSTNLKQEYRDIKYIKGAETEVSALSCPDLKKLLGAIHTLPVSTAECERGFSQMNVICTPLRTRSTVHHMSSLLFISIVGPPLPVWQPTSYVRSWLAKGRHAATDLGKAKSAKSKPEQSRLAIWNCF
jgi:hAT family C-terminal dimerisation region